MPATLQNLYFRGCSYCLYLHYRLMKIKRKTNGVIAELEKFFDIVDQSLLVFDEGVKNYLHRDIKAVNENLQSIVKLENDSSLLQRDIEASLYRDEMSSNGDVLRLLERMRLIVNLLNNDLYQFEIERPNIPAELNPDFLKLLELSSQAVTNTIPASKAFFHTPEVLQDKVRRIYFYQKEADRQAKALKRKVFHEMDSLKLSEKVHLRYFALHIEELALQARNVADQLSVMSIRSLPSRKGSSARFWGALGTGLLMSGCIAAAAVLILRNPSGIFVSGSNSALTAVLIVLSIILVIVLATQIVRNRRERRHTSTRLQAQEDEINDSIRKMSEMEVQLMKAENDHLQNLLDLKRKETTGVVEKISEQREFINSIYDAVLQAESADEQTRSELLHDIKSQLGLRRNATGEQEDFYAQVEQMHKDFSVRLASKFPQLTAQERKLATLLRLEFSTKYIASLLNISPKSVEIERHRMRTKMGLSRDVKLTDFIKNI